MLTTTNTTGPTYAGATLATWEEDAGDMDSRYVAEVWDAALGQTRLVIFDHTRWGQYAPGDERSFANRRPRGRAMVDATPDVVMAATLSLAERFHSVGWLVASAIGDAGVPQMGDTVTVEGKRCKHRGTKGTVAWIGTSEYSGERRLGIVPADGPMFYVDAYRCAVAPGVAEDRADVSPETFAAWCIGGAGWVTPEARAALVGHYAHVLSLPRSQRFGGSPAQ